MLYNDTVKYLEALQIMPKTMPGLNKIKQALVSMSWFDQINANQIILVAGTNGKGSTAAALEALLLSADLNVGLYTSPHLISTNERIRFNGINITEEKFIEVFNDCKNTIDQYELSHFEAITLMMGYYFFSAKFSLKVDYAILEVGLGGLFDATNAFPHKYSIITKIGLDHQNILGNTLEEIAKNKFGVIGRKSVVVHHKLDTHLLGLKEQYKKETNSNWIESNLYEWKLKDGSYGLIYDQATYATNLIGPRAIENISTAITLFEVLGYNFLSHSKAIGKINWLGRMNKVFKHQLKCDLYLSGDHNVQGIDSLIEILNEFKWKTLHMVVGVGIDKDHQEILQKLFNITNVKIYLTETPFKGCRLDQYHQEFYDKAYFKNSDLKMVMQEVSRQSDSNDVCVVTGSLYLIGLYLNLFPDK